MDNWVPADTSPGSYQPGSPVAPGYAAYPVAAAQTSATWATSPLEATVGPESNARPEDAWSPYQQPARSMSFSGEPSAQYAGPMSRPYDRKASVTSDMYHPTGIESISQGSYTTWQQPYQPWYAEGGQSASSAAENPSQMDGVYYGR